jgi:hypothetical protein
MNSATGHLATLDPFKEDACSVTFAQEKVINPGPTVIYVSFQEFLPGKSQPIGNTLPFCQTNINLVLGAAHTTAAAFHGEF